MDRSRDITPCHLYDDDDDEDDDDDDDDIKCIWLEKISN